MSSRFSCLVVIMSTSPLASIAPVSASRVPSSAINLLHLAAIAPRNQTAQRTFVINQHPTRKRQAAIAKLKLPVQRATRFPSRRDQTQTVYRNHHHETRQHHLALGSPSWQRGNNKDVGLVVRPVADLYACKQPLPYPGGCGKKPSQEAVTKDHRNEHHKKAVALFRAHDVADIVLTPFRRHLRVLSDTKASDTRLSKRLISHFPLAARSDMCVLG